MNIDHHGDIGYMKMQSDGNLVVYSTGDEAMWNTGTSGHPNAFLKFQDDGNLVIIKENGKDVIWQTGTGLAQQDYDYEWRNDAKVIDRCDKSVHHSLGGEYELRLQCNKQLVLKKKEDGFTHDIKTFDLDLAGPHAVVDHLIMQKNGDLVVYSTDKEVMWQTNTSGNDSAHFEIEDDGNLVIYNSLEVAIWNSNT